jgi:hypothetical protein
MRQRSGRRRRLVDDHAQIGSAVDREGRMLGGRARTGLGSIGLGGKGLLIGDAPDSADMRARDDDLRASHWHGRAAVTHASIGRAICRATRRAGA